MSFARSGSLFSPMSVLAGRQIGGLRYARANPGLGQTRFEIITLARCAGFGLKSKIRLKNEKFVPLLLTSLELGTISGGDVVVMWRAQRACCRVTPADRPLRALLNKNSNGNSVATKVNAGGSDRHREARARARARSIKNNSSDKLPFVTCRATYRLA